MMTIASIIEEFDINYFRINYLMKDNNYKGQRC